MGIRWNVLWHVLLDPFLTHIKYTYKYILIFYTFTIQNWGEGKVKIFEVKRGDRYSQEKEIG